MRTEAALDEPLKTLPVADAVRVTGGLTYQVGRTSCGPATLASAARSLGRADVTQETLLDDGKTDLKSGMTAEALAELARRRLGWSASTLTNLSLRELRLHLELSNDLSRRYVVNFHRAPLFGSGGGHHSLLGGFSEKDDSVLVLDVNRSFGPWRVSSARLHAAIDTVDLESGSKRGLILLGPCGI